jgi:tRNA(fMet)-specific endonuclease VapC
MKVLLDTNAYSDLLRGNSLIADLLDNSETIFMSVIVIAELLTGFKGGFKEKKNIEILNEFLINPNVITIDVSIKTASIFSDIKHFLKEQGKPLPINDIWIAAHSYEFQTTLITYDKHFEVIPKIDIWKF